MSMHTLYQQIILDHYQQPRNYGLINPYDFISPMYNPSCGDSITISGRIEHEKIVAIGFEGKGCVISLAMASLLTEHVSGQTIKQIESYDEQLVEQLLLMQLGIKRMQCGLLSIQAIQKGLQLLQKK